jgi:fructokinase
MSKVFAYGEVLFDLINQQEFIGGATLNFAAHLSQLGTEVYIISRVGNDPLGKKALDEIKKFGIQSKFVQIDPTHPTGTVRVLLDKGQPNYMIQDDVAYDHIQGLPISEIPINKESDLLYFGSLIQRSENSKNQLYELLNSTHFKYIFYDCNLREGYYNKEIIEKSLQYANIVKLNDHELEVISILFFDENLPMRTFCIKLHNTFKIKTIIITAGAEGCYVYHHGIMIFEKSEPVIVADTIGAGDAFCAGFVQQLLQNQTIQIAAKAGNMMGGFVASSQGATPLLPFELVDALK